eukprot:gnl/TRDRNA2_/TRDRNA2_173402_c0_seq1.p1 gnl/TRDRNA2_/TRDRNA2_173402_c0~~gnl/TRDRNA2_/TRDRNA2_173402_c0_seq1.p1  ORF type:complete len:338 (+),score=49.20 gnl/TRDRNA2_/TRDRNA2_173402_c0_seq1:52-1014(+)
MEDTGGPTAGEEKASFLHEAPASDAAAWDSDRPRSGSSAMPDPQSPNVPRLHARVHSRLSEEDCAKIPLSSLKFRPLQVADFNEMIALHTEWFPVSYDEAFYTKSVQGEIFTIAATHCSKPAGEGGEEEEDILGIVTFSTACEHHCDDIFEVLQTTCAVACCGGRGGNGNPEGADESGGSMGALAYILTLGVVDGFRRRGLARLLLQRTVVHISKHMPHVQAVYLYVVTYNEAAIRLYEASRFLYLTRCRDFYQLHGRPYDSYLYALYINGCQPPWRLRLRRLLSWKEWIFTAWSLLWRAEDGLAIEDRERPAQQSGGVP